MLDVYAQPPLLAQTTSHRTKGYSRPALEQTPLQAYYSAIVFPPANSIVRQHFYKPDTLLDRKITPRAKELKLGVADARRPH
jgi:hypothetical protein